MIRWLECNVVYCIMGNNILENDKSALLSYCIYFKLNSKFYIYICLFIRICYYTKKM